jgi:hypothetical protein
VYIPTPAQLGPAWPALGSWGADKIASRVICRGAHARHGVATARTRSLGVCLFLFVFGNDTGSTGSRDRDGLGIACLPATLAQTLAMPSTPNLIGCPSQHRGRPGSRSLGCRQDRDLSSRPSGTGCDLVIFRVGCPSALYLCNKTLIMRPSFRSQPVVGAWVYNSTALQQNVSCASATLSRATTLVSLPWESKTK